MVPIRQLVDILIISTALVVSLWIIFAVQKAKDNPLVMTVLGFLLTTIGWMAWLGFEMVFLGHSTLEIGWTTVTILVLVALILFTALLKPQDLAQKLGLWKLALFLFLGAWVVALGILAVLGLSTVDAYYIEEHWISWVILSLTVALCLQVVLKFALKGPPQQPPPPNVGGGHGTGQQGPFGP